MVCYNCKNHEAVIQKHITTRKFKDIVNVCRECDELMDIKVKGGVAFILFICGIFPCVIYIALVKLKEKKAKQKWEQYYLEHEKQ